MFRDLRGCTPVCSDKARKVKCGKENRRPRVLMIAPKRRFEWKWQPCWRAEDEQERAGGCLHVSAGPLRLSRLHPAAQMQMNFEIRYKAQRKHWRSGHVFQRWTSSKVTPWSSVRGCSPPSWAPVRCTSGWSFCGSWLLSHSSSTSPAPEDFSAWIIQPTGIVNERFVIRSPARGAPN